MNSQAGIATENSNINQCESAIKQYEYEFEKKYEHDLKVLFTDFEVNLQNPILRNFFFDAIKQEAEYMSDFDVLFDLLLTFKTNISKNDDELGKNVGYQIFKVINQIHNSVGTNHIHPSSFEQKYYIFITQKICDKDLFNHLKELFSSSKENAKLEQENELMKNSNMSSTIDEIILASDITKIKEYINMIYKNSLKVLSIFYSNLINNDMPFQFKLTDFHKKSLFDFYKMEKPTLRKLEEKNEENKEERKDIDNEINNIEKSCPAKIMKGSVVVPFDNEKIRSAQGVMISKV